jgi:hypothetical protein
MTLDNRAFLGWAILMGLAVGVPTVSPKAAARPRRPIPKAEALVGVWREQPTACQSGASPIGEFQLKAQTFSVTWEPYESYHDYTGTYRFDAASGDLSMTATGGAYLPPDAKLTGTARIRPDGRLEVAGVDFGTPRAGKAHVAGCPAVFEKQVFN